MGKLKFSCGDHEPREVLGAEKKTLERNMREKMKKTKSTSSGKSEDFKRFEDFAD